MMDPDISILVFWFQRRRDTTTFSFRRNLPLSVACAVAEIFQNPLSDDREWPAPSSRSL